MSSALSPTVPKLVRLLGSDEDYEALGAARGLKRVLANSGHDLNWLGDRIEEVITPAARAPVPRHYYAPVDWRQTLQFCNRNRYRLTDRELDLIEALACWRGYPSDKQLLWLQSIFRKIVGGQ